MDGSCWQGLTASGIVTPLPAMDIQIDIDGAAEALAKIQISRTCIVAVWEDGNGEFHCQPRQWTWQGINVTCSPDMQGDVPKIREALVKALPLSNVF
jgi:hypothetical protein